MLEQLTWKPRNPRVMEIIRNEHRSPDDDEITFLQRINLKPNDSKGQHQAGLGWSNNKFRNVQNRLKTKLLIEDVRVGFGRGGQKQIFGLTQKGREFLKDKGKRVLKTPRGGLKHGYFIHKLIQILQAQGYEAKSEHLLPGPEIFLDIWAHKDEKSLGIEIELSDLVHGLKKLDVLIQANVLDDIFFISDRADFVSKAKRAIKREFPHYKRIQIFHVKEILKG